MKIDNNYSANSDTYGWTLTFSEERERVKKDGVKEMYTFEDHTYHGSLKQCLLKYIDLNLKGIGSAKEVLEKLEQVEETVKKFRNVK